MTQPLQQSRVYAAAVSASGIIAGSALLFTSFAKDAFPPLTLTLGRLSIGSLFLLAVIILLGEVRFLSRLKHVEVAELALIGILNTAIPYSLTAAAMGAGVSVGIAAGMAGAIPIFAAVFDFMLVKPKFGEVRSTAWFMGLFIGLLGVALVATQKQMTSSELKVTSFSGALLQLTAMMAKALAAVLARRHNVVRRTATSPLLQALLQAVAGALAVMLLVLMLDCTGHTPKLLDPKELTKERQCLEVFVRADSKAWLSLLFLSFFSSGVIYILQFFLFQKVGAVRQTLTDQLALVVGVLEGTLINKDWDHDSALEVACALLGMAFIMAGMALLYRKVPITHACESSCPEQANPALLGIPETSSG